MTVERTRRGGSKGIPRQEREAQILSAAHEEFVQRGYAGGAIDRIASSLGISRAMVHAYFSTKDALYAECLRRAGEPLVAAVASAQTSADPQQRALDTIRAFLTALEGRRGDWLLLYDPTVLANTESATLSRQLRRDLAGLGTAGTSDALQQVGNIDPLDASLAQSIWLGTVRTVVDWWLTHLDESPEATLRRLERLLGALAHP